MATSIIVSPFGITYYELTKLLLLVVVLVVLIVLSTMVHVRLNNIAVENARIAQSQAEEAKARAEINSRLIDFARGQQAGLEDRIEKVEEKAEKPIIAPRVIVVIPTQGPPSTPRATRTPNHPRGGLGGLLLHKGDRAP